MAPGLETNGQGKHFGPLHNNGMLSVLIKGNFNEYTQHTNS